MARTGSLDPTSPSSFFLIPYVGISPIRLVGLHSKGVFHDPESAYPASMVHPTRISLLPSSAPDDINRMPQLKTMRA